MFLSREGPLSKIKISFRKQNSFTKSTFFTYSRDALNKILEVNNIQHSDEIIVPDYICSTVLEVILPVTKKIKFYKINDELGLNEIEIMNLISIQTKLIIFVDYFGVQTSISKKLESYLKKKNILIVKDAAHSFLSIQKNDYVKDYDYDYLISSIYKNLPLQVGSIAIGDFNNTQNFINFFTLIKRFSVLFLKNLIYFVKLRKFIPNREFDIKISNLIYKNSSYGVNASCIYLILLKFIDFEKIIEEKRELTKVFDSFIRKNTSFKPMIDVETTDNNILQAYPLIFKSKGERDDLLKIMIENRIDAYTWPTFHEINYNETLWNKVLLLPIENKVIEVISNV